MTVSEAYFWTTVLTCIGLCQGSLADLIVSVRHRAIMNFPIASDGLVSRHMKAFHLAYDGTGAWVLKILTLLCALACIVLVLAGLNPGFVLLAIFIFHLLSYPRWRYFVSSDSPLLRAVLVVLVLHYFLPDNRVITEAGILFLSIYLVLIYHLTGLQKLKSVMWRNGQATGSFLRRFPFWRKAFPITDKPVWLLRLLGWSVILLETGFFLGLIWPDLAWLFVVAGLLFHFAISFSVGINHFFWTFIAVYPAYIYMSGQVLKTISSFANLYEGL